MSDQNFREIQLSGKQLVFLFMSAVVLAVVIFLLGVSVGRGVRGAFGAGPPAEAESGQAGDTSVAATPAPVQNPAQLDYHETLQGQPPSGEKPPAEPPTPPAEEPPGTSTPPPAAAAQPPATESQAATTKPAPKPAEPAATKPATPAAGSWFVQVNAFSSKANAQNQVSQLKAKNIQAFVFDIGSGGARFRVRVGPFAEEAQARAMSDRLKKEGFRPSVIR